MADVTGRSRCSSSILDAPLDRQPQGDCVGAARVGVIAQN